MFTSTFGLPHPPAGSTTPPDAGGASPQQVALLRILEQAIDPDGCRGAERPCGGCNACQTSFSF